MEALLKVFLSILYYIPVNSSMYLSRCLVCYDPKDGGNSVLRNAGSLPQHYTAGAGVAQLVQ